MGFLSADAPEYNAADVNDPTKKAMEDKKRRIEGKPLEQYQDEALQGVDRSGQLQKSLQEQQLKDRSLGGPDYSAMHEALNRKAQKNYNVDLDRIRSKAKDQSHVSQFNDLQSLQGDTLHDYQTLAGIANNEENARIQGEAYRDQMIGALFGAAGTAGGMAYAKSMQQRPQMQTNSNNFSYDSGSSVPSTYHSKYFGNVGG